MADGMTYSGLVKKKPRGIGFGLGKFESAIVVAVPVIASFAVTELLKGLTPPVLWWGVLGLCGLALVLILRVGALPVWEVVYREAALLASRCLGRGKFVSSLVSADPDAYSELPGPLEHIEAWNHAGMGAINEFGVVVNRVTQEATVSWNCHPVARVLVDEAAATKWTQQWGNLLSSLGESKRYKHVVVTVVSSVQRDSVMMENVSKRRAKEIPDLVETVMDEVLESERRGNPTTQTVLSATFDLSVGSNRLKTDEDYQKAIVDLSSLISGMSQRLLLSGCSSAELMSDSEQAAFLRAAFDPDLDSSTSLELAHDSDVSLRESGPIVAEDKRKYVRHDSWATTTSIMSQPPRQEFGSNVLAKLMEPSADFVKRLSIVYHPVMAADAQDLLEKDRNHRRILRMVKQSKGAGTSAVEDIEQDQADQNAFANAAGAGVCQFSIVSAVSVALDPSWTVEQTERELDRVREQLDDDALQSKVRLRPITGGHSLGLATTVGAGIDVTSAAERLRQ